MQEECLICKAPLTCLKRDKMMACAICHKQELSKTCCVEGHCVCSDCHTLRMDSIFGLCLSETSRDPIFILEKMMSMPFCHMHGPEHHMMVGAELLTAYKNADGEINLSKVLQEMYSRGKAVLAALLDSGEPAAPVSAPDRLSPLLRVRRPLRWNLGV